MHCKLLAMNICTAAALDESQACSDVWWPCQNAVVNNLPALVLDLLAVSKPSKSHVEHMSVKNGFC